jgi:hypothetical protein
LGFLIQDKDQIFSGALFDRMDYAVHLATMRSVIFWSLAGLTYAYVPLDFQRRFTHGIMIPLAFIAVYGCRELNIKISERYQQAKMFRFWKMGIVGLIGLATISNWLLVTTGLYVVTLTEHKMYSGHPIETLGYQQKKLNTEAIYRGERDREWLMEQGIRWVINGPYETQHGGSLKFSADLNGEYRNSDVEIFRVY